MDSQRRERGRTSVVRFCGSRLDLLNFARQLPACPLFLFTDAASLRMSKKLIHTPLMIKFFNVLLFDTLEKQIETKASQTHASF